MSLARFPASLAGSTIYACRHLRVPKTTATKKNKN